MKCARCSAEIPKQSQFCLRCGTPIAGTAANPTGAVAPPFAIPQSKPNNRPFQIAIGALALLVLALGALVLRGQLTQKPSEPTGGALVQAPGEGNSGKMVQAPAETPPNKLVDEPAPVPADIIDYLAFLKQIEATKQQLIRAMLADALADKASALGKQADAINSDDPNAMQNFLATPEKKDSERANQWNALTISFGQRVPPDSCTDLHNKYYDQLAKLQAQHLQLAEGLRKAQSDPSSALQELTSMLGTASAEADAVIRSADDALAEVCRKYNLKKDFDIKGDPDSASLIR